MLIKVCGMSSHKQVQEIAEIADYVGFIFYEKSKRFVETTPKVSGSRKTGVFVNSTEAEINERISNESLNAIQLHGSETAEFCSKFSSSVSVIKAFGIDVDFNFEILEAYEQHVDFFLFDTKTPLHGGSGKQYDWSILKNYRGKTPFFLSGGIQPSSLEQISNFRHSQFAGIDLNSGFEYSPGDKNINEIEEFIKLIKKSSDEI